MKSRRAAPEGNGWKGLGDFVLKVMIFPWIVPKLCRNVTFSATIGIDLLAMKFLAVISTLALLTMSGAAISDQILTADQHAAQGVQERGW